MHRFCLSWYTHINRNCIMHLHILVTVCGLCATTKLHNAMLRSQCTHHASLISSPQNVYPPIVLCPLLWEICTHTHTHHTSLCCMEGASLYQMWLAAMNKLVNLKGAGKGALEDEYLYGITNIKKYNKDRVPLGYPGWPYNKFNISHDAVIKALRGQMNGIAHSFCMPAPEPSDSELDSVSITAGEFILLRQLQL